MVPLKKILVAIAVWLLSPIAIADEKDWPSTVPEAVERMLPELTPVQIIEMRGTAKTDLIKYHFLFGMGIRNEFGLWKGNTELLLDCGQEHLEPDACSMVIIEALWDRLRPELSLEEQQELQSFNSIVEGVPVPPYSVVDGGLKAYVEYINRAISNSNSEDWRIRLVSVGISDDYRLLDFSHSDSRSLEKILRFFEGQHLAVILRSPPYIVLQPLPFLREW